MTENVLFWQTRRLISFAIDPHHVVFLYLGQHGYILYLCNKRRKALQTELRASGFPDIQMANAFFCLFL
jgi:hypothetical protein